MEAYCVKCKSKREIQSPQAITMKNGRPATSGTCPVCKTKVFRIGAAKQFGPADAGIVTNPAEPNIRRISVSLKSSH